MYIHRLLNDDPNHQVYQFESHPFADNNVNNNSSDSAESPFSADLFEESNDVESDDFYGRTREIIIFAEKGNTHHTFRLLLMCSEVLMELFNVLLDLCMKCVFLLHYACCWKYINK